jgi:uncharacterized protein YqcC (DUF446 family)
MQDASLTTLLDAIEAELRRLGYLRELSPPPIGVTSAFGYGQVSFEQWLGRVFLPNARAAVASNDLPATSQVAVAAFRDFDGVDEADALVGLLGRFDSRINQLGRARTSWGGA